MSEILSLAGMYNDKRGSLHYFNNLDLKEVRRMYILEHPDPAIIRAWQGHKYEKKWFLVTSGSFKVVLVEPDNWETPSDKLKCKEYYLTENNLQILEIPGGFATGFQAEEPNSKLMVFSSQTLEESKNDDYRFEKDKWYNWAL